MSKDYEELELTKDQIKAAKAVYSAIRKAGKLGVHFWDDYGTFSAYNGNKIRRLAMDYENDRTDIEVHDNNLEYHETLKNYHAGNADDKVYVVPF